MAVRSVQEADSSVQRVAVDLGERSYDVVIGRRVLDDPAEWRSPPRGPSAMVLTNSTVAPFYLERLLRVLRERHYRVHSVELPDGEQHKDWATLNRVFDALLQSRCDRDTT